MSNRNRHPRLTANAIAAAKPRAKEYTLWDGTLAHFGVRVGRLLGHRQRETTAIYAHLDDGVLRDAAAQAAAAIARAMGYRAMPPSVPDDADDAGNVSELDQSESWSRQRVPLNPLEPTTTPNSKRLNETESKSAPENRADRREIDWLGDAPVKGTNRVDA